jgi:outer membrane lipoprotein SlyB
MRVRSALFIAALAAFSTVHADDLRTGVGGALGGAGGAAIGNHVGGSTGAIVGAGVGGAAGAVIGGKMTEDSKPSTQATGAPQAVHAPVTPAVSCNRNNPGKGRALGHCKH